jgi:hypothetical protein
MPLEPDPLAFKLLPTRHAQQRRHGGSANKACRAAHGKLTRCTRSGALASSVADPNSRGAAAQLPRCAACPTFLGGMRVRRAMRQASLALPVAHSATRTLSMLPPPGRPAPRTRITAGFAPHSKACMMQYNIPRFYRLPKPRRKQAGTAMHHSATRLGTQSPSHPPTNQQALRPAAPADGSSRASGGSQSTSGWWMAWSW